jgi:hypothetical protein
MKKYVLCLLLPVLLAGCTLESEFGLPNDEKIDIRLLGEWGVKKENAEYVSILKNSNNTYKILLVSNDTTQEILAHSKTIKGHRIINLSNDNGTSNTFYAFKVNANTLTFFEVNDQLTDKEFVSESALLSYFEENIKKKNFFINKTKWKRK